MKNKRRGICTALILSLLLTMVPLQVFAADTTKELTIIAASEKEARKQAEEKLEETIKKDGKSYQLTDIQYEVLETEYVNTVEKKMELLEPPKEILKEGGMTYTLKSFETKERNKEGIEEQIITAYEEYDHAISPLDVAPTKTVIGVNQATGEEEQVECQFTEITTSGTKAVDQTMTITFTNYDSAYYEWNGQLLPHNDQVPPLKGQEASLLASVGASEGSIVTDFWWAGDPYVVEGVVCRDANTTVRQKIQLYRANYQGLIDIPKETVYTAIYEAPDETGDQKVTIKASGVYEKVYQISFMVMAGIGILLLLFFVVLVLYVVSKKKKEEIKSDSTMRKE